ncbi:hypothetical protein VN12_09415 [Pirellula sp. SH-Sr6A]|uniref:hypothetical protein n=1 Tax=Pirellula sp. SH-Sr6A TaxID=1632865 RepID=UPI00078EDD97|nr:hypothetical protein [Pirellula sp. SH-Sr6A]AMV32330.1 hypothetical protein VN12_09415 [Pirellula sp. SH-Sr6A]
MSNTPTGATSESTQTACFSGIIIVGAVTVNDNRGDFLNNEGSPGSMSILTPKSESPDQVRRCLPKTMNVASSAYRDTPCVQVAGNTEYQIAARSRPTGGVALSLCVGSARFTSQSIDQNAWVSHLSGRGGEVSTLDD